MAPINFSSNMLRSFSNSWSKILPKTSIITQWNASRHSTSRWTDDVATSFRKTPQEGNCEHCQTSNDFPWYSFHAMPIWSANRYSRFRVKWLLTFGFVKPSCGWNRAGGQSNGTVRLESRIGELEQLKKLCLCDCWLDVSFHSSNSSEVICKTGQLHPTGAIIKNSGNIPQ